MIHVNDREAIYAEIDVLDKYTGARGIASCCLEVDLHESDVQKRTVYRLRAAFVPWSDVRTITAKEPAVPIPAEENDADQVKLATLMCECHTRGGKMTAAEERECQRLKAKVQAHNDKKRSPADLAEKLAEQNRARP